MTWVVHELNADTLVIQDDDRVVGSIVRANGIWQVEILWGGPGGDLTYASESRVKAQAFVEGVEKAFALIEAGRRM